MDDAFKGVYRPDRVQFYRTQATNSQIGDLLRHEDELIAENAAMQEIVQAVSAYGYDTGGVCAFCNRGILHAPDCPVTKARTILAAHGSVL